MLVRTISALIGAPLLLGLTYLGGYYTAFLISVLSFLALWEFLRLGERIGVKAWYIPVFGASFMWLLTVFWGEGVWRLPLLVLWLLVSLGMFALTYPEFDLHSALYNFLSMFYPVALMSHLYLVRELPSGIKWAFLTFFLVWSTDTGAYIIGRSLGRHLLAPKVSPKKTVEGSVGGFLTSVGVGLILWRSMGGAPLEVFLGLAVIVGITAQVGDLFESALKRSAQVKDSGSLIPGHGGILDRFDSFMFALPLVYYFLVIFKF
ncbi:phosphatidate cytidylyltransferase [Paradesulfitobacterium ferrireducens]|uniref:phosphatidate cytidylyltransferase n=1 Tax=Paradesulfitobacterium ferrireducens TaxID=2816476 RepID=UPI001A906D6B|nr:phosphatidate cytidylyltransferase [Paradesulfitobacterium ferrireducens]